MSMLVCTPEVPVNQVKIAGAPWIAACVQGKGRCQGVNLFTMKQERLSEEASTAQGAF